MPLPRIGGLGLVLAAAACSPSGGASGLGGSPTDVASNAGGQRGGGAHLPSSFKETAWRTEGRDGARYTTFLDDQGRYRDFRDGVLWHEGDWTRGPDGGLCMTPDGEGAVRACWQLDTMTRDGTLTVTGDDDVEIALVKIDYSGPKPAKPQ